MNNEIQRFIARVSERMDLSREDSMRAFQIMMLGAATPAQVASLLTGLRMKGETVEEIIGAATVMRVKMQAFQAPAEAIDVCGTGGDAKGSYNVSTAVAIVVAACGVPVVKHGNKSVSSKSGSADLFQALGVDIQASPATMQACLAQCGLCFLFAPLYHKATRHVAPVRQELGIRTLFNLLGPLVNPANPARQLLGVYDKALLQPVAEVLRALGTHSAWVVHGEDGMDELTLTGPSYIAALKNGKITRFTVTPEEAGLARVEEALLKGGDIRYNARELNLLFTGKASAYRDIVLLNAAAALLIADKVTTLRQGVEFAASVIDSGKARETVAAFAHLSQEQTVHV